MICCYFLLSCSLKASERTLVVIQKSKRKMLTEPLPAVAEIQPLYGSVDAVWAHDRPGNEQKHNRFKNISTSWLIQNRPLSSLSTQLHKIIKSSQDFVIVSPLPPSLSPFFPPFVLQPATYKLLARTNTAAEPHCDLDVGKLQQTWTVSVLNRLETIKGTLHSSYYILDSPCGDSALVCVRVWECAFKRFVGARVQIKAEEIPQTWFTWSCCLLVLSRGSAQRQSRDRVSRGCFSVSLCVCVCTYPTVGLPVTSHSPTVEQGVNREHFAHGFIKLYLWWKPSEVLLILAVCRFWVLSSLFSTDVNNPVIHNVDAHTTKKCKLVLCRVTLRWRLNEKVACIIFVLQHRTNN